MGFIAEKIQHSSITVRNLDESVQFYHDFLGLEKVSEVDMLIDQEGYYKGVKVKIAYLKAGDDELELVEYITPKAEKKNDLKPWDTGAQHIAFNVSGLEKIYNEHKKKVKFLTPPIDVKTEEGYITFTHLRDPNGAIIEIAEVHKD